MKKITFSIALALVCAVTARAVEQNNGLDFFLIEQYDKAKKFFEQQAGAGTGVAEANYYLGEIACIQGDLTQAKAYYEKGLAADPAYALNKVGLAKFLIKTDAQAADKGLTAISKSDKKNVVLLLAIAKVYYDNGMTEKADKMLASAAKADKKSPLVPMFNGDLKRTTDVGAAAGDYEQAILRNRSYLIPYIKIAQIYVNINPRAALERLAEALEIQPDYLPAKQYQARAYYNLGAYDRAIEIYQKIFDENTSPINDLTDYGASLFFAQRYNEAQAVINKGFAKAPNNFVLNRLMMYSALEQEDYEQGLAAAQRFFALPIGDNKYIPRDYTTYGDILSALPHPPSPPAPPAPPSASATAPAPPKPPVPPLEASIEKYNKAAELVSEKELPELYRQISEKLNKSAYFTAAADFYQKFVDAQMLLDGEIGAVEYFTLGQYYYKAAMQVSKDSTRLAELPAYLDRADSSFATVTELAPDNISSIIFRARIGALRDPNTELGVAKPFYEAALEVVLEKNSTDKYRRELLEIYRYLSYFYYVQYEAKGDVKTKAKEDDKQKTLDYCQKMLELDPNNAVAKQLTDALTEKPKPTAKKSK